MDLEPALRVAFSMYSTPGAYALLIGSGVASAAGVPTGWDIVLDLIRKLAASRGEDAGPEPAEWYLGAFGVEPLYDRLLDQLTRTSAERMALLRPYFEPTDEEREQGVKVPTAAHRAIAAMVRMGFVRMILTTNFDRLIETAIQDEGIVPTVVSSVDGLKGAMPYVHSKCIVAKLHGDYLDTRVRNTPDELAKYPAPLNQFLDRVFDDFGLVICGWSATWDVALRKAILRAPNRRFATYWLVRGDPTDAGKELIQQRKAEVIRIGSANDSLSDIREKVQSLKELDSSPPLSVTAAVATVKRYLVDTAHRIRLYDLVHGECESAFERLVPVCTTTVNTPIGQQDFQHRMHQCESAMERLVAMLAAIGYFDDGGNSYLLTQCIERLMQLPDKGNSSAIMELRNYPALLLTYVTGVAALAAKRYGNLAATIRVPRYRDRYSRESRPAVTVLNPWSAFQNMRGWTPVSNAEKRNTPVSDYLYEVLRSLLREYLPSDADYGDAFDLFEYVLSVTYVDLVRDDWAPVGRFGRVYRHQPERSPVQHFLAEGASRGSEWEFLRAGFFNASADRLNEVTAKYAEWVQRVTGGWW